MRFKSVLIGTAAGLVLGGSVVGTAHAATGTVPFITGVSIKMITPGTLTKSGALAGSFDIDILETGASNGAGFFNVWRDTTEFGDQEIDSFQSGNVGTDLVEDSFGTTTYEIVACEFSNSNCQSDGGGPHGGVDSATFTPSTIDNPFVITTGTGAVTSNAKYYGGTALQTTTNGASVTWTTGSVFNLGVVIDTGPKGGIGQVYVDGKKIKGSAGLINFYSAKLAGCLVDFKFGTASATAHTVKIVMTTAGTKGGFAMNLDAGVEFIG
jgi:hypothetical protein